MFKLEKDQLLQLDDTQLRELVARLCEAELLSKSQPSRNVRWGGAQTAPDEGIDVECLVEDDNFIGNFVPRSHTIFQVKVSKMSPYAIKKEMSPTGQLRPIFSKLAKNNGCYIIVSLKDDLTASKQETREEVMREAAARNKVTNAEDSNNLYMKFYGLNDLTRWLDDHPSVQLWVREKLGLTITGWRDHDRWSMTPSNVDDSFVCGPGVEIILPGKKPKRLDIESGVNEIRELVRNSNDAVRIIGLSGVGKTRIVQALFEKSVGNNPLDSSLARYADMGDEDEVDPKPSKFLEDINAKSHKAIVILDNCSSKKHNNYAKLVASFSNSSQSSVTLITIEYDIREDIPEFTQVVRIETNIDDIVDSAGITYNIIKNRYSKLGIVNTQCIVHFSNGNARLALALAERVEEKEDLSKFSDDQFFQRLVHQRNASDDRLLRCAEVLALVDSFSIEDKNGMDELAVLSNLIGYSRDDLYRNTQVLLDRGLVLVQRCGERYAVLPHTLAKRLASRALRNIPEGKILNAFENPENKRMLQLFARRLRYSRDDKYAESILNSWLSEGGVLHNLYNLDDDRIKLLFNIAPVAPERVLEAIENQAEEICNSFYKNKLESSLVDGLFTRLLIQIAYEANFFERCVNLLAKFAFEQGKDNPSKTIYSDLCALFRLYSSGTQAGLNLRESIVRRFILSKNSREQSLGLGMLEKALSNETSLSICDFGAHPRFYDGPQPQEEEEWFSRFIELGRTVAANKDHLTQAQKARKLLAKEFTFIFDHFPNLHQGLASLASSLNENRPWLEGWSAIQGIKNRNNHKSKQQGISNDIDIEQDELDNINNLLKILRPKSLADEVRTYVLAPSTFDQKPDERQKAYNLGQASVNEPNVIDDILSELFLSSSRVTYLSDFGKGMAASHSDLQTLWTQLVKEFEATENYGSTPGISSQFPSFLFPKKVREKQRYYGNPELLYGAFEGIYKRDESLAQKILDKAIESPALRSIIVKLYSRAPNLGCIRERLEKVLKFKDVPLSQFSYVELFLKEALNEEDFLNLMRKLLDKKETIPIILNNLCSRHIRLMCNNMDPSNKLKRFSLFVSIKFLRNSLCKDQYKSVLNYYIPKILESCLNEEIDVVNIFKASWFFSKKNNSNYLRNIFLVLSKKSPFVFLDTIFLNSDQKMRYYKSIFNAQELNHEENPLSEVDIQDLLKWCKQGNFQERLIDISKFICPFKTTFGKPINSKPECADQAHHLRLALTEQARDLINEAESPASILKNFAYKNEKVIVMGARADKIKSQRQAFEVLFSHKREDVRNAANIITSNLQKQEEMEEQKDREKQ